ncbi:lipase member H-like [Ischnura elegans]|uniref:lipase member H-like n=1 Tax=Ischnura elegans TaxID=197161 RepID=UPI001ED8A937|nr:lipase member H-like [Ischnura elegans]
MTGKTMLWITLVAAFVTMEIGVAVGVGDGEAGSNSTDDQHPQTIHVVSVPSGNETWPEVMYFPDENGEPTPGLIYGEADYVQATRDDLVYVLYTRRGPATGETLKFGDAEMLRRSSFDRLKPTVFVTHGFQSTAKSPCVNDIKDMYMGFHEVNLIAVDWSRITLSINYYAVKNQTISVGGFVAEFVHFLQVWGGVDLGSIHLIGHSLGAHVMGIAGKTFRNQPKKIGRITGLDPAGPLFKLSDPSTRLDSADADFVDVIHTCAGWLGFTEPIGRVDFFPNGGSRQPGCSLDRITMGICSHSRAWQFYAESINSINFSSLPCKSYDDYNNNKLSCDIFRKAPMGQPAPARITGNYFLNTAPSPPFALGG